MQLPLVEQVSTAGSVELTQPDADTDGSDERLRPVSISLLVKMNWPVTAAEPVGTMMETYTILPENV